MSQRAAFFDLDRTLIAGSSSVVIQEHLVAAGVTQHRDIPFADRLMAYYERYGENWFLMQPARYAARANRGWDVALVREAAEAAAEELLGMLQPFALDLFDDLRAQKHQLVMATTSPQPLLAPFAEALGFDDLISTRWEQRDGRFTGETEGPFLWGRAKAAAVKKWAAENQVSLKRSRAYSDSYFDAPLLDLVGTGVAVNPDFQLEATARLNGWEIRHLDKSEGVMTVAGRELQEWSRPYMHPKLVAPYADIHFEGVENVPAEGPALIVFNHRSYFDPTVMGLLAARAGRNIRGLGKKEVFDAPVIGPIMKAVGGIRVERASGSDEPLIRAATALRGGECVMMAPQGTIPRGPAFFDPELKGRWGAARLAAQTDVPIVPVGLWGTEHVWPRSSRLPNFTLTDQPRVDVVVGEPFRLENDDPEDGTRRIMAAIQELLPDEAREIREPTPEELARTYPPGYSGNPDAEADRRPGTDT